MSSSNNRFKPVVSNEKNAQTSLIASPRRALSTKSIEHVVASNKMKIKMESTNDLVSFLVKLVALETVRRISTARCPFIWNTVQALQFLTFPPFKWIHKWTPIGFLVKGIQKFSKPLLLLSVVNALADCSKGFDKPDIESNGTTDSASSSNTDTNRNSDEPTEDIIPENWTVQISRELEKQGVTLPERIDENELERFRGAADGDMAILISSLKRTIKWRETYHILSFEELETWSHLVFWHGHDVLLRPCLVIRLGFACNNLVPKDRPLFTQAIVSQIEHGIMHLVNKEDPRITVLMDCKGTSPFRFPMQMLRSVSTLVQENYPNRLGRLVLIRLPPIVRVITQTFLQVLKPTTRQKVRLEGEAYKKALSEIVEIIPAFLGGNCNCAQCMKILGKLGERLEELRGDGKNVTRERTDEVDGTLLVENEGEEVNECNNVLRPIILGFLMLWIVFAFLVGMNESAEPFSLLPQ